MKTRTCEEPTNFLSSKTETKAFILKMIEERLVQQGTKENSTKNIYTSADFFALSKTKNKTKKQTSSSPYTSTFIEKSQVKKKLSKKCPQRVVLFKHLKYRSEVCMCVHRGPEDSIPQMLCLSSVLLRKRWQHLCDKYPVIQVHWGVWSMN